MKQKLITYWSRLEPKWALSICLATAIMLLWVTYLSVVGASENYYQSKYQQHSELLPIYQRLQQLDFESLAVEPEEEFDLLVKTSDVATSVGISISRIVPDEVNQSVLVDFLNVQHADLIQFFHQLESSGISVQSANIEKMLTEGRVTARVELY